MALTDYTRLRQRQLETMRPITLIGFDSAWTDNPRAPGAICALELGDGECRFHPPHLVGFDAAAEFIQGLHSDDACTLVALDQPTIVRNLLSMRPVERVAASLVSWLGGGVQPSNRGRTGMFCDQAPIWRFLSRLQALEKPEVSRTAETGLHLIEVFPALALASVDSTFFGRMAAPRYNPARRKTYKAADWRRVGTATAEAFRRHGLEDVASWCDAMSTMERPRKADQDMLDAVLCLLIAVRWRLSPRSECMVIGCLDHGYMVLPASADVRARLEVAAERYGVPVA